MFQWSVTIVVVVWLRLLIIGISRISVLETARANSMDVWRWDRNHNEWELIMRYKDSEEEFWAENKDRPDFQKIYQHKRVWKYLSQLLIPWTDEELDAKEKCYWEQVVSC